MKVKFNKNDLKKGLAGMHFILFIFHKQCLQKYSPKDLQPCQSVMTTENKLKIVSKYYNSGSFHTQFCFNFSFFCFCLQILKEYDFVTHFNIG